MDHDQDLTKDGMAVDPWRLCTIDQVEELKAIINIIPLWSTGIMLCVNANTTSIRVLQAMSVDRHIFTPSFEIPPASFGTFALISLMLWLILYDRVIIPLASNIMGKPVRINIKTRMGIGLVISFVCSLVAGIVESTRREKAMKQVTISALWLVPQVCLIGLAEGFTAIAQIEFFYSEFPRSMSSIASNLFGLSTAIASLVASLIMSVVDRVTTSFGKESWVSSDVNIGHYDYYYWILASLSLVNYIYFVFCSRAYDQGKTSFQDAKDTSDDGE